MIYSTENSGSYFGLKLIKSLIILETYKDSHSTTHKGPNLSTVFV